MGHWLADMNLGGLLLHSLCRTTKANALAKLPSTKPQSLVVIVKKDKPIIK